MSFAVVSPFGAITSAPWAHPPPQPTLDASLSVENDEAEIPSSPANDVREATLERGDSLPNVLVEAGASPVDAMGAIRALTRIFDLRSIKAGQSFELIFAAPPPPKPVAEIIYTPPNATAALQDRARPMPARGVFLLSDRLLANRRA